MAKEKKTKDKVFELLESRNMNFISGQEIADTLYITRAGIWKAVKALREEGFNIEAVNNRGYRLVLDKDSLSTAGVENFLSEYKENGLQIEVFKEVTSTNDKAREFELSGCGDCVVISDYQSAGRGRRGRSFFSPKGMGLYISFLLHPDMDISRVTPVTCMAAVATARAIEKVTGKNPSIKWVNDLYLEDKKICGILTEGFTSIEDGSLSYIVVGIGINLYMPPSGFPEDIKKTAGVVFGEGQTEANIRNRLSASLIHEFMTLYRNNETKDYYEEYKSRLNLIGSYVKILSPDKQATGDYAYVTGIDKDFHLCVEYEDKSVGVLSTGEVSVVKY